MPRIPTVVNPLQLRRTMGRKTWAPPEPFGPCGFRMYAFRHDRVEPIGTIIVTTSELADAQASGDFTDWTHASFSWVHRVPTYDELVLLKSAVWGDDGEAYQVHPRAERHVNLHEHALHLWGRADGAPVLPDFGKLGTI